MLGVAHTVVVPQFARNWNRHNFHVFMRVRVKTLARLDNVVIDYPQKAETHPLRIVVVSE
jgi:hypothetical protein